MGEVRFMISEAAKQVHVESHVLRYWEEELDLKIGRTEMGHRYYTEDDIQLFLCIRKLKNEGMLLRDLKPLIPQLTATRKKLADAASKSQNTNLKPLNTQPISADTPAASANTNLIPTDSDVIPVTQLEQARSLIGDVLTEVVTSNNAVLEQQISKKVTNDVIREMDFLFQAKERQEEEHYRKLDNLIRQQQTLRRETASRENPLGRFRKIFT